MVAQREETSTATTSVVAPLGLMAEGAVEGCCEGASVAMILRLTLCFCDFSTVLTSFTPFTAFP